MKKGDTVMIPNSGMGGVWKCVAIHLTKWGTRHDLENIKSGVRWERVNIDDWDWTLLA